MTAPAREDALEAQVRRAQGGDRRSLEAVVAAVQDQVFNLAVRMLWHPQDAEDATQEILVRIVTRLHSFRGDSQFRTWAWRLAANYLLSMRKRRMETATMSFDEFAADLERGRAPEGDLTKYPDGEQALLVEEVKIGCTLAMLLCLDREHRMAYLLGEVFQVTSEEGGYILDVTAAAFRKRLSRARDRVRRFMTAHCGLVDPGNTCRCSRRVEPAVALGRVAPGRYLFARADAAGFGGALRRALEEMEDMHRAAAIYRDHPSWATPHAVAETVRRVLDSQRFETLLQSRPAE